MELQTPEDVRHANSLKKQDDAYTAAVMRSIGVEPVTQSEPGPAPAKTGRDIINVASPPIPTGPITGTKVLESVTKVSGYSKSVLKSAARDKGLVHWRQIACYLMRRRTGLSYNQIGVVLGNRDHTTVIYSIRRAEERYEKMRADIEAVEALL